MNPLTAYLLVSSLLFSVGLAGALTRRNAILVLVGVELDAQCREPQLHRLLALWPHPEALTGVLFVIFSIAVAAAEAAVGLALSSPSTAIPKPRT